MKRVVHALAALAVLGIAAGAGAQTPASKPAPAAKSEPRGGGSLARGEADFLRKAGEHGMAEVDLGQLAQQKGAHGEVQAFGARMVADHGKANEELKRIAAAKGVELPTAPDKKHQRGRDQLAEKAGPEFDRAYMKRMVDDHEKDVREFERMAKDAKDPEVKDFATRQLGVLRGHLQAARATLDLSQGSKRTGDRETGSKKR